MQLQEKEWGIRVDSLSLLEPLCVVCESSRWGSAIFLPWIQQDFVLMIWQGKDHLLADPAELDIYILTHSSASRAALNVWQQ